jgi:hypothetical protein
MPPCSRISRMTSRVTWTWLRLLLQPYAYAACLHRPSRRAASSRACASALLLHPRQRHPRLLPCQCAPLQRCAPRQRSVPAAQHLHAPHLCSARARRRLPGAAPPSARAAAARAPPTTNCRAPTPARRSCAPPGALRAKPSRPCRRLVEEREGHEREREMTPPVEGGGSQIQEEQREKGKIVTVRVFVMLGIYFVSVKYMFVKCKACVCLCETFENLKVQVKKRVFL